MPTYLFNLSSEHSSAVTMSKIDSKEIGSKCNRATEGSILAKDNDISQFDLSRVGSSAGGESRLLTFSSQCITAHKNLRFG